LVLVMRVVLLLVRPPRLTDHAGVSRPTMSGRERLHHLLILLAVCGEDVIHTRPACYSGVGFTPALRAAEADGHVVLVGLDRLYRGQ
ncbi:hypothetical protein ABZ656_25820, partial [Streptomyces sp. NPDC007095]